ncbi:MAG: hypothetical protein M1829_000323 [Trizodia sp. TS-e1964]|nr:MAG: hypothetical protein M1829_000323 [Trizodia sp. TS-e1964]
MATPTSRLDRLPQEVLEEIFVASTNFDLPLVSRHLRAQLSSPFLKKRVAVSMLLSNDAAIQSDLLGRRFFDLALFDAATREITPPCTHSLSDRCPHGFEYSWLVRVAEFDEGWSHFDSDNTSNASVRQSEYYALYPDVPHFKFAPDIMISPRLLCNFQTACTSVASSPPGRFWKIEVARRMVAGKIRFFSEGPPFLNIVSDEAMAAAQRGFYEAIRASNLDALMLLSCRLRPHWQPFVRVDWQAFRYAVVDMDCADKAIVRFLGFFRPYLHNNSSAVSEVKEWVEQRQLRDCRLRLMGPGYQQDGLEGEWADLWTGEWLHAIARRWRFPPFDEFVSDRVKELEEAER